MAGLVLPQILSAAEGCQDALPPKSCALRSLPQRHPWHLLCPPLHLTLPIIPASLLCFLQSAYLPMLCVLSVSLKEHKLPAGRDCPLFYFLLNPQHPVPRTQPMLTSHLAHETTLFKVLERAQTSTTKTDNWILTWAKDLNRPFFKEDICGQ